MNFLLLFGLFGLLVVSDVFSKPSCSSERNLIKNKEETSCTNLGLSALPLSDIPKNTAILLLSYNNFKSLSTSMFKGFKDLTDLEVTDNGMTNFDIDIPLMIEELNLANNSLTKLPKVSQLSALTTLHLSNNRISTIEDNAFMGLKRLTMLKLQHNQIDSLSEEVFMALPSLEHLDLSYNQLWHLPDRLLSGSENLNILYLSGNRLTEIPDHFFGDLELSYVYLEKNPWNCNCALLYFKNWLEADEDRVYEEGPTKNQRSVICSDGTPLIDFDMDHCLIRSKGDINFPPFTTKNFVTKKVVKTTTPTTQETTVLPTTTPTTQETTALPTTTPTTQETTVLPTTTPTTQETTALPTTTPTTQETTMLPTTTPTTQETVLPTTTPTTQETTMLQTTTPTTPETTTFTTTKPTTQETTMFPTTTPTTPETTMLQTTTPTTPETTMLQTTTPTTQVTTLMTSITVGITTSEEIEKASTIGSTIESLLPPRSSRVAAFGVDWLANVILEHCCFLHVIIYGLCILLLLAEMIITMICLLWIYCCNQDLLQWLPGIRLIRYSMRVSMSDDDILLVNNGALESHFRDQSLAGVTKMLVLESDTRQQGIRYTSAIL